MLTTIEVGQSGTVTVTKSPNIEVEELTVEIGGTGVIPSINQSTGVITFTVAPDTLVDDYVATISCGDAPSVNVVITVAAPSNTGDLTVEPAGYLRIRAMNTWYDIVVSRGTQLSQDEMTAEFVILDPLKPYDPTKFNFELVSVTFNSETNIWSNNYRVMQIVGFSRSEGAPYIKFTCNGVETLKRVMPLATTN